MFPQNPRLLELLSSCLKKRRSSCHAINKLNEAWRECSQSLPSLNRKPLWPSLPTQKAQQDVRQTEMHIKSLEKIQQETFLMFQGLCSENQTQQIAEGEELLQLLQIPQPETKHTHLLERYTAFLAREAQINRAHVQEIQKIYRNTEKLHSKLVKIQKTNRTSSPVKKILDEKNRTLQKFLTATKKMLTPIAEPSKKTSRKNQKL